MRRVAAPLAAEIHARIAAVAGRRLLIARPKTLLARPRLQQRPIDREMLVGQQLRRVRVDQHGLEKRGGDVAIEQAVTIFVNVVGDHTGSSIPRPTNQRNSRLKSSCSINCRSERTV